jgi:hypothetical protein
MIECFESLPLGKCATTDNLNPDARGMTRAQPTIKSDRKRPIDKRMKIVGSLCAFW